MDGGPMGSGPTQVCSGQKLGWLGCCVWRPVCLLGCLDFVGLHCSFSSEIRIHAFFILEQAYNYEGTSGMDRVLHTVPTKVTAVMN